MQLPITNHKLQMSCKSNFSCTRTTDNKDSSTDMLSPSKFLQQRFPHVQKKRCRQAMASAKATQDEQYKMELVRAIRSNDISSLRSMLQGGDSFDACNRNGESLLHLACRRGNFETVRFLLEEGEANSDVQDDMGRTVLHDICWKPIPDFELMELLLMRISPTYLFAEDCRGHCCFDYARQEHWGAWIQFLEKYTPLIERRLAVAGCKQ